MVKCGECLKEKMAREFKAEDEKREHDLAEHEKCQCPEDRGILGTAYDKTAELAAKAGEMTKTAASDVMETVHDYVTGDTRSKTEKTWDEAKEHLSKGTEKAEEYAKQKLQETFKTDAAQKEWEKAKDEMNTGVEKVKQCGTQQAHEAKDYIGEKTHEAARHIESH